MRDDLLDSQACVDWAVSQFPSFAERIAAWVESNLNLAIEDPDPNIPNRVIVAIEKEPLPRQFNVEVGVYINAIRTSLDLLATALAERYGIPRSDQAYFPVAKSEAVFWADGDYKGVKFVKGLPPAERNKIKSLLPYKGGNPTLWALHQLDIMRKHRRLLTVRLDALTFMIRGPDLDKFFTQVATGFTRADNISQRKVILGLLAKAAPPQQYDMQFSPYVAFGETELVGDSGVPEALDEFARLATAIIALFD